MSEYVLDLPKDGRDIVGKKIGPHRGAWPKDRWFDPGPLIAQGVTKLRIRGHGNNIMPGPGADATVCVDEPRMIVQLEGDMTIHCAGKRALLVGEGSAGTSEPRPIRLDVESGDKGGVLVKGRPSDELGGKWAFDSYQHTGRLVGLRLNSETCVGDGHARYGRGSGDLELINCFVDGAYKEGWKEATRGGPSMWASKEDWTKHTPYGTPWAGMPLWRFGGCVVRRFAASGFGGGIIFQPNAAMTVIEDCTIEDTHDSGAMLLGMNDGTTLEGFESWAYGEDERGHPAGGPLIVTRTVFLAEESKGKVPRILVEDCVGVAFVECSFILHPDARIEIRSPQLPNSP